VQAYIYTYIYFALFRSPTAFSLNSLSSGTHLCAFNTCRFPRCSSFTVFAPEGPGLVGQAQVESCLWQYH